MVWVRHNVGVAHADHTDFAFFVDHAYDAPKPSEQGQEGAKICDSSHGPVATKWRRCQLHLGGRLGGSRPEYLHSIYGFDGKHSAELHSSAGEG